MDPDDTTLILDFYGGHGIDHRGRTLTQILQKSDRWLEETHDYIQWLFPLYVRSEFNPHAPLLTDDARNAFLNRDHSDNARLQRNFAAAIQRMLIFYGYFNGPLTPDRVDPTGEWSDKAENWLTDGNHNFLRMTRMLRCMTLLGREALARSFHGCLIAAARAHPRIISERTIDFWDEAVRTPSFDT
jgi:Opioid growth factor receptor (OGFr) conserved region